MDVLIDRLETLGVRRIAAWEAFKTGDKGAGQEIERLDPLIEKAVQAVNERIDILYREYINACDAYYLARSRHNKARHLERVVDVRRNAWLYARQLAGLMPGDTHVRWIY